MPGVADAVRRTQSRQSKEERKKEMEEIVRMVKEGRLHEADERQMEALYLATQLNGLNTQPQSLDPNLIQDIIKNAIGQALQNVSPTQSSGQVNDVSRPSMKHVSLSDLSQEGPKVEISNSNKMEGQSSTGEDNSANKLEMLKKIKGNG